MKYVCSLCGKEISKNYSYCPKCGGKISWEGKTATSTKVPNYLRLYVHKVEPPMEVQKPKIIAARAKNIKPLNNSEARVIEDKGSFALGFWLAFLLSVIGVLIVLGINKKRTTKGGFVGLPLEILIGGIVTGIIFAIILNS